MSIGPGRTTRRKRLGTVCAFAVVAAALSLPARAQTPYAQIYFDEEGTQTGAYCPDAPPGYVLDTLTVYVHNVNSFIIAAELRVELPPALLYLGFVSSADVVIGDPVVGTDPWYVPGAGFGWSRPQAAFEPFLVTSIVVVWMCDHCSGPIVDSFVRVRPHMDTGSLSVVTWPAIEPMILVGSWAIVCPHTAVESTTWGAVKALYGKDVP